MGDWEPGFRILGYGFPVLRVFYNKSRDQIVTVN